MIWRRECFLVCLFGGVAVAFIANAFSDFILILTSVHGNIFCLSQWSSINNELTWHRNYIDFFSSSWSQERCKKMSRVYYKGAMGALVVFDITKSSTLEAASEWKQDLDRNVCLTSGQSVPAVLLANKCDIKGRDRDVVSSLDGFCKDNSFMGWFETSAKVWRKKITWVWLLFLWSPPDLAINSWFSLRVKTHAQ